MIISKILNKTTIIFLFPSLLISQISLLPSNEFFNEKQNNNFLEKHPFSIIFSQLSYINTNLPNLENLNGYYIPKGYGSYTSFLYSYKSKNIMLSAEPTLWHKNTYEIKPPSKDKLFSVLNDVPQSAVYRYQKFRNIGFKLFYKKISLGYGNWNQWWGPGIHNSLTLTNNSDGFFHYFFNYKSILPYKKNIDYNIKYMVSEKFTNLNNDNFYLSSLFLNIKYNDIEFGYSRNYLSGGYFDIPWTLNDAMLLILTQKNVKYWDFTNIFYLKLNNKNSGTEAFIELGFPNSLTSEINTDYYSLDHNRASNVGLRKKGAFGYPNMFFGLEYARIVQSTYYNLLPSPNWYDNIKYNYSSYNGRRWGAHSGSDSDDLLLFLGYEDEFKSIVYSINYERHGVNYKFPPEVKFESRFSVSYAIKDTKFIIFYENEYFEHYGFVDSNVNIWEESFEEGSVQRTKTLIFSISRKIL
tara:strand:- start:4379 stop:5779 length:1401 start_codon:yes stop_codon:yes gene_type:complete